MTSVAALTAQVNSGTYSNWPGSRYVEVSGSDYRAVFGSNDINFVLGKSITGTHIPANTTIVDGYIPSSNNWGYFRLSKNTTGSIPGGSIDHYTIAYNAALVNKNYAYLTTASVDSAGTVVGTAITGISGGGTFPANTLSLINI